MLERIMDMSRQVQSWVKEHYPQYSITRLDLYFTTVAPIIVSENTQTLYPQRFTFNVDAIDFSYPTPHRRLSLEISALGSDLTLLNERKEFHP